MDSREVVRVLEVLKGFILFEMQLKSFLKFYRVEVQGKPPFKKGIKYLDKNLTKEELR
ncbi:MAG: hypothetical protein QXP55_04085 [Nitrososphaerales archaeon]